jgi:hypothetical protein
VQGRRSRRCRPSVGAARSWSESPARRCKTSSYWSSGCRLFACRRSNTLPTPSTKARQWWGPCRPRVSTGVAPGRVHCGTGRLVGPQVAFPSASERQYQQIGEPAHRPASRPAGPRASPRGCPPTPRGGRRASCRAGPGTRWPARCPGRSWSRCGPAARHGPPARWPSRVELPGWWHGCRPSRILLAGVLALEEPVASRGRRVRPGSPGRLGTSGCGSCPGGRPAGRCGRRRSHAGPGAGWPGHAHAGTRHSRPASRRTPGWAHPG